MIYLCPECDGVLKETYANNKDGKTKFLFFCPKCMKTYDFKLILKEVEKK